MITRTLRAAAVAAAMLAAAMLGLAASADAADDCETVTQSLKTMIDKLKFEGEKPQAAKCAAVAEGLGMMKLLRIVREECLEEGEEKRFKELAEIDRPVRKLQTQIDTSCQ
jgi:hypothetical protein